MSRLNLNSAVVRKLVTRALSPEPSDASVVEFRNSPNIFAGQGILWEDQP